MGELFKLSLFWHYFKSFGFLCTYKSGSMYDKTNLLSQIEKLCSLNGAQSKGNGNIKLKENIKTF